MLSSKAQNVKWDKTDTKLYGTYAEKQHQDMIGNSSGNRFLCRFIGFKTFYIGNLSMYLQTQLSYSEDDLLEKPGIYTYVLSKKGVYMGNEKPKTLRIAINYNKDERITAGKVTGGFSDLAKLFLNYWPQDATFATEAQLKPGVAAVKHCYGDLISFKWNGTTPYISILKDPNMTVPVKMDTVARVN